jgi:hypothetical protein
MISRLPEFQAIAHEDGKVVSPTHRLPLIPLGIFLVLHLLEAEPTQRPWCGRKESFN